ncbi:tetratricopeptide repeat protein [Rhizobium miluonense]|jgi:tetratricopeptide (TPR) repeat protein|uniref:Tetratricopeptide (TPR) repeat protein n=1 Tax=Rhizobium miluonense TaxID=411945 RepID=A0ABU1SXS0_9HYPH|nr:tetratricopeptide repeat protein [Rhizobium miluonense]MDR6903237.1 tetratricopeptide (TPR) repeat protein [Rhizobium miluonense]
MRRELRFASTLLRVGQAEKEAAEADTPVNALAAADAARDRRDWAAAAFYYRQALKQNPARVSLFVQLGHAHKENGDFDAALEAYQHFLAEEPDDVDIHLQLGHLYNRMNEWESALQWYEQAHVLAPDNADIAAHLESARLRFSRIDIERKRQNAMELLQSRRWHQARAQLYDLVETDGEIDLIAVYANATKEAGDFDEALRLYDVYREYAQNLDAASVIDVEIQTAHLYKAMRDIDAALRYYIRARDAEFSLYGHVTPDSIASREIRACMAEIYTCFWHSD